MSFPPELTLPSSQTPARKVRQKDNRAAALKALKTWRYETVRTRYRESSYTDVGFMSDDMVASLVYDATLSSVADIERKLNNPPWIFATRHGEEVLELLRRVDAQFPLTARRKAHAAVPDQSHVHGDENAPPSPSSSGRDSPEADEWSVIVAGPEPEVERRPQPQPRPRAKETQRLGVRQIPRPLTQQVCRTSSY